MWLDLKGPYWPDTALTGTGTWWGGNARSSYRPSPHETHDHRSMGTVTLPTPGRIQAMEATLGKGAWTAVCWVYSPLRWPTGIPLGCRM